MKVYKINCENCGADLRVAEGRKVIYCEYCGTKHTLDDGVKRSEFTIRDEAKIIETEAYERIRMREIELEREWRENRKRSMRKWSKICLAALIIGCILIGLAWMIYGDFFEDSGIGGIGILSLVIGMVGFVYGGFGYFVSLLLHYLKQRKS